MLSVLSRHRRLGIGVLAASLMLVLSAPVSSNTRDQAKRLHDRIAGVPPSEEMLKDMVDEMTSSNAVNAALLATETPEFYSVTLKNFAAPWTNREDSVFVALNDYTASVIGLVRDDMDFRQILTSDVLYIGSGPNVPPYSANNNAHFEALEANGADLKAVLQSVPQSSVTGIPASATAGVMTTRGAAKSFFIAGTNRAMFRFTFKNHMCKDMEQVHDTSRAPDRIRQDVSRSPGGDSRVFLNNCIGCHSGMDPMAQAFAYYDYVHDVLNDPTGENGSLTYNSVNDVDPATGTRVESKYFNNAQNFPPGFATPDDSWTNYWRSGPNELLGWDNSLSGSGTGARSMGQELAHSQTFSRCQVEKVFANVCLRPVRDALDRSQIDAMVTSFAASGYNLKQVFAESAVYCMGD
ncbi:MAG: hypothetical protein O3A63_21500 [Proteobacteria bacterium]|nr:hypothetical protein [Pseudomonadota bacterium]